jgi:thymidylate synthase
MIVFMRSNDAYRGLPHDIFAFTMLQEIIARSLEVELGTYKHSVGSLHLYDYDAENAQRYLDEGFQDAHPMPRMPDGDPWPSISKVLELETQIRLGKVNPTYPEDLPEFWSDLVRILNIYALAEGGAEKREIVTLKKAMSTDVYDSYARKFERKAKIKPAQQELPLESNDER